MSLRETSTFTDVCVDHLQVEELRNQQEVEKRKQEVVHNQMMECVRQQYEASIEGESHFLILVWSVVAQWLAVSLIWSLVVVVVCLISTGRSFALWLNWLLLLHCNCMIGRLSVVHWCDSWSVSLCVCVCVSELKQIQQTDVESLQRTLAQTEVSLSVCFTTDLIFTQMSLFIHTLLTDAYSQEFSNCV